MTKLAQLLLTGPPGGALSFLLDRLPRPSVVLCLKCSRARHRKVRARSYVRAHLLEAAFQLGVWEPTSVEDYIRHDQRASLAPRVAERRLSL